MILSDFKADKLNVKVFETRNELGQEAAKEAKDCILNLLTQKVEINILFAYNRVDAERDINNIKYSILFISLDNDYFCNSALMFIGLLISQL